MLIHTYLNLPDFTFLPGRENYLNTSYENSDVNSQIPTTAVNNHGVEMGIIKYVRTIAEPEYTAHSISLIPELENKITEIGFQVISNDTNHPNGAQFLPHTDGKRGKFCIHWNFTTGGENVTTYWWQEKDQPLVREPWTLRWYTNLTEVSRVTWLPNRWGIFRTDILHGVNTVRSHRHAFTIGFNDEDLFHHIVEKYGVKGGILKYRVK